MMMAATAVDPKACDERVGVGRRLGAATDWWQRGVVVTCSRRWCWLPLLSKACVE